MKRLSATLARGGGRSSPRSPTLSFLPHPRRVPLLLVLSCLLCGGRAQDTRRGLQPLEFDARYSVKFDGCHGPGGGRRQEAGRGSFVTFRLCDTPIDNPDALDGSGSSGGGAASCETCRDSGHGAMTVALVDYLEITLDHHRERQERRCEACRGCAELGAGCAEAVASGCREECQTSATMEDTGYLDAANFIDCVLLSQGVYGGPACAADGARIEIGLFADAECTVPRAGDADAYASLFGKTDGREAFACVARCGDDGEDRWSDPESGAGAVSVVEVRPVCEELYRASLGGDYDYDDEEEQRGDDPAPNGNGTSVCRAGEEDGAGRMLQHMTPHFCTNAGRCSVRTTTTDAGELVEVSACTCPDGFYGKHCELVWEEGADREEDGRAGEFLKEEAEAVEVDIIFEDDDDDLFYGPSYADDASNYTVREYNALAAFYRITQGDRWRASELWLSDGVGVCDWYGVGCDAARSVTSLELGRNGITGDIEYVEGFTLRHLGNLSTLNLEGNFLYGTLPHGLGDRLRSLTRLKLGSNNMRGSIPESLSRMPHLESLELQENSFSWSVMNTGYSSLRNLSLGNNYLSGTLQYDLARLHGLVLVSLERNELSGRLPNYPLLENLTKFDISGNRISGTLPPFSDNLKLRYLNVSRNHLGGHIDRDTMMGAFNRSAGPFALDLGFNFFEGTLPSFEVDRLNINVVGNLLLGLDPKACARALWNEAATDRFGCDGIACPAGTASAAGRQTSDAEPCAPCSSAPHYGTVGCDEATSVCRAGEEDGAGRMLQRTPPFCANAGRCSVRTTTIGMEVSVCSCPDGFYGKHCELVREASADREEDEWEEEFLKEEAESVEGDNIFEDEASLNVVEDAAIIYSRCPPGSMGERCESAFQSTPTPLPSAMPVRSSYLQVLRGDSLFKLGGYDHRVSSFGPQSFSGIANVYYAEADLCDDEQDMTERLSPFILMVDRGQCTFVQKVRFAQSIGALAVVIADNTCLCEAGDSCKPALDQPCEKGWAVLADDGSGRDINIPSFLILKQDADPIKNELQANNEVVMELSSYWSTEYCEYVERCHCENAFEEAYADEACEAQCHTNGDIHNQCVEQDNQNNNGVPVTDNVAPLPDASATIESSVAESTADPKANVPDSSAKPSSAPPVQTPSPTAEATAVETETIFSGQYAVPCWQSSFISLLCPLAFSVFGSSFVE